MNSVRIWSDPTRNQLFLVFPPALSEAEVESASLRLRAAIRQLRPGFCITVSHELAAGDEAISEGTIPADRFAAARRMGRVKRVLRAADDRLVA